MLLVIEYPLLAAHFTREIDRLWKSAELGITDRIARKPQQRRMLCGEGDRRGRRLGWRLDGTWRGVGIQQTTAALQHFDAERLTEQRATELRIGRLWARLCYICKTAISSSNANFR
jgi:hypothetical protein